MLNFPELIPESLPYVAEAKQKQMEQEAARRRASATKRFGWRGGEGGAAPEQRRLEKEEKATPPRDERSRPSARKARPAARSGRSAHSLQQPQLQSTRVSIGHIMA